VRPASQEAIRVGLIGAGANLRGVQIPGFRKIPGVDIVAVANRSLASSQRVADEFGIARAYANWAELLEDDSIQAVSIGTWPYMHRTLTLAALESGKHVLCQARMANNAQEARDMLEASLRHPDLVCQLVPTSMSYRIDNVLKRMIGDGYVGDILSVELQRMQTRFPTVDGELDWRHDREFSGLNTLNIGASYESMMRWLGRGDRVMAMTQIHVPYRRDTRGDLTSVTIPDHVDALFELAGGAQVHLRASETTGLSTGSQTWIYGSEGTIHVDRRQNVFAGRRGDSELTPVPNPPEEQAFYRVEEEFINAIRGVEEVTMATFETGVHYMEWTEAVHSSSQTGQTMSLPL
jgi:predicted dehydrogenase